MHTDFRIDGTQPAVNLSVLFAELVGKAIIVIVDSVEVGVFDFPLYPVKRADAHKGSNARRRLDSQPQFAASVEVVRSCEAGQCSASCQPIGCVRFGPDFRPAQGRVSAWINQNAAAEVRAAKALRVSRI